MVDIADYQIIKDPEFGRRKSKPGRNYICYRTVLAYIGHKIMSEGDGNQFKDILAELMGCINNKTPMGNKYIELYYVTSPNEAHILVDQTNGTFPLVLYHSPKDSESSRVKAFLAALNDLIDNYENIFEFLKGRVWSIELQRDLQIQVFKYRTVEERLDNDFYSDES